MTASLSGKLEGIGAFALAGSAVPIGAMLLSSLSPWGAAFLSLAGALAAFAPILAARRKEIASLGARGIANVALQALSGMALYRICLFWGLSMTSASRAGVISAMTPAAFALLSAVALKERLGPRSIASVALCAGGIVIMRLPAGGMGDGSLFGDALVLLSVFLEAAMTALRKKARAPLDATLNAGLIVAFSFAFTLPFAAPGLAADLGGIDAKAALGLAYYGFAATGLAYVLWGRAARRLKGSEIALCTACMPISALALSAALLGEIPSAVVALGAAAAIASMLIPQEGPRAAHPERQSP